MSSATTGRSSTPSRRAPSKGTDSHKSFLFALFLIQLKKNVLRVIIFWNMANRQACVLRVLISAAELYLLFDNDKLVWQWDSLSSVITLHQWLTCHADISKTRLQQSSREIRAGGLELSDTGSGIRVITHWHTDAFACCVLTLKKKFDDPSLIYCTYWRWAGCCWLILCQKMRNNCNESVNIKRSTVLHLRPSLLLLPTAAHLLWVRFLVLPA